MNFPVDSDEDSRDDTEAMMKVPPNRVEIFAIHGVLVESERWRLGSCICYSH